MAFCYARLAHLPRFGEVEFATIFMVLQRLRDTRFAQVLAVLNVIYFSLLTRLGNIVF
jgi:uncharacterized membrane protein YhaH (DUF805 family)